MSNQKDSGLISANQAIEASKKQYTRLVDPIKKKLREKYMRIGMSTKFEDMDEDTKRIEYAPKFSWEKAAEEEAKDKFDPPSRD